MKKVLVVDDEISITDGLTALFRLDDIDADGAYDRESAEALLVEDYFPVILADLRLRTEEEGLALLDSIRQLSPNSRIATLTAFATPEVEADILSRGSSVVLRKPMSFDDIVAVVTEMLEAIETEAAAQQSATGELDLDALYDGVKKMLYSIPQRRFGLTAEETDDLVQDAWMLFLQKRQWIVNHKPWLTGTVANLCKQRIYKNTRKRATTRELVDADAETLAAVCEDSVATLAVRQAMAGLDARGRSLCTLIGIEGRSYEEVSAELAIPIGSVGPLYIRAKAKLRRTLEAAN